MANIYRNTSCSASNEMSWSNTSCKTTKTGTDPTSVTNKFGATVYYSGTTSGSINDNASDSFGEGEWDFAESSGGQGLITLTVTGNE